jgi:SMI1 / KNR4 family (SUKH-1)
MSILDVLPPGSWSPASHGADEAVAALEQRVGRRLPADLAELHRRCCKISLQEDRYRFLEPAEMNPIGEVQTGDVTEDLAPRSWLAVIDLGDGNYVAVDLVPNVDGSYNWLDCFHETIGEAAVIATSLVEFVRQALAHPDGLYWLAQGHAPYRTLTYENPTSYWRKADGKYFAELGDECGPGRCANESCGRLRILHSVMCRKHHYEMVRGRPSPFGED